MDRINQIGISEAREILDGNIPPKVSCHFNTEYKLNQSQIENYSENGFIKLGNVVDKKFLGYSEKVVSSGVLLRKENDERTLAEKSAYEQSFLQCGYLAWDFLPIRELVFGKRFAEIAKCLMRADSVRLWHDQALYKEPKGRFTPVHQDSSYWPVSEPENSITMWLALSKVTIDSGCLYFYPGSHKWEKEYVDIFRNPHIPEQIKDKNKIFVELNPGDATFHSGLTFHGTENNQTENFRKGMTVIYIAGGNKFDATDVRNATHKSCSGLVHGNIIDTEFTPILA